ncbi:MAG: hypothetical protein ABI587_10035 [Gemmatimonadales bacterium]
MATFRSVLNRVLPWSVLIGSVAATYVVVSTLRVERSSRARAAGAQADSTRPRVNPFASANGTHLIAFLITASDCGWSNQPRTMAAIGDIRQAMRSAYGSSYAKVSVVGIALDDDLDTGLRFLAKLGKGRLDWSFDQVAVGGSWLNEEVVRFVWREGVARAASPQVIVVERAVDTKSYLSMSTIGVQGDRLIANLVGSEQILQWVAAGLTLNPSPKGDSFSRAASH